VRPKTELVRFVVGPGGAVVPDLAGRLPGRGLWCAAERDIVAAAVARRAFARAARAPVTASENLHDRVEALLVERCCELIGLARRAGEAVAGFEKVHEALARGRAGLVLAAADGAPGGREKLERAAAGLPVVAVLTAAELGLAFGRDHVVHGAVARGRLAEALAVDTGRLAGFRRRRN
jgi:predicted RNA-binding protein YlxR (DUF448 family)/ribosomal protein L30E